MEFAAGNPVGKDMIVITPWHRKVAFLKDFNGTFLGDIAFPLVKSFISHSCVMAPLW
jgi:hypothetical protein